jgi:hypothetical protein
MSIFGYTSISYSTIPPAMILRELNARGPPEGDERINPTITLYWNNGNFIISLSCFVIRPTPTEEGKF